MLVRDFTKTFLADSALDTRARDSFEETFNKKMTASVSLAILPRLTYADTD
jgi:hypothetical protein